MARTCHGNAVLCLSSAGIVPSSSLTEKTMPRLWSCEVDLIHLITTGRVQGLLPAATCTQGESNTKSSLKNECTKEKKKNERTKGPRLRQSGWVVTLAVGHLFLIDLKAQVAGCYRMLYVFLVFKEFMSFAILVFWNYSSHHWYKN